VPDLRLGQSSGPPGTVVRASGTGARSRERITIVLGNNLATADAIASTQGSWTTNVTIPTAPGGRLKVQASGAGGQAAEASFTVTPIIGLVQASGFPGSRVELKGEGFLPNQSGIPINFGDLLVGSASAEPLGSWLEEIIIPPSAAGAYRLRVPGSGSALQVSFRVTAGLSVSKPQGSPGETITVVGSGFARDERGITVYLGDETLGTGIIANEDGAWNLRFKIPPLPTGAYVVFADGSLTPSANIREDALVLGTHLSLSDSSGTPGMTIEVKGAGFLVNEAEIYVTYDDVVVAQGISADSFGSFARSFVVPASTSGSHLIAAISSNDGKDGNATTESRFQIEPGISLAQAKGPPGKSLMISGAGFGADEQNISLTYDGTPVISGIAANNLGSFQSSFLIPPSGAGPHSIKARSSVSGAADSSGQTFAVIPSLELSAATGNIDLTVTIIGHGFEPGSTAILTYDQLTQATVTADGDGSVRLNFRIPESEKGEHVIRLTDERRNSEPALFIVENTPPVAPSLREPGDGGSGGFLGGFQPKTRWQNVEDPSGVRYTLQIATDPDFDDVILEKAGLEKPRYTLVDQEKLPRGSYFWRVRAIDKASNESGWSNVRELQSGIMPIWLLSVLAAIGFLASGGGAYVLTQSRKRARATAISDLIQILPPRVTPALSAPPSAPSLAAPSLAAPLRRALPSPFRGPKALSREDQARLEHVMVFIHSIPLPEVAANLDWIDEMIQIGGGVKEDIYEQILEGQLDLVYQPAWLQHPTYNAMGHLAQLGPFLQSLEEHVKIVNECSQQTVTLLRAIAGDISAEPPLDTLNGNRWRFVLTVAVGTLAWFWGTHLENPSSRDYAIEPSQDSERGGPDEPPLVSLKGAESSPFIGPILEGLSEDDARLFRDLHVQRRISYRTSEAAQVLAAKLASSDLLRHQIIERTSQLGQQSTPR